ncbi:hypothetical protein HDU91_007415 [Kappamyces sp. JEL0680]|nr:hypothetical protein HDU91_007415 [Kappamyces sp. JEL0680]
MSVESHATHSPDSQELSQWSGIADEFKIFSSAREVSDERIGKINRVHLKLGHFMEKKEPFTFNAATKLLSIILERTIEKLKTLIKLQEDLDQG